MTLEEQETTINFSRDNAAADVWTSDRTVMTRFDKLTAAAPEFYKLIAENKSAEGELLSKEYRITDKTLLSFRATKRTLTDEQKEQKRIMMQALHRNGNI